MKSIKNTLSRYLLIGASVLLLVTFFFQEHRFRTQLESNFDLSLLTKAKALITLTTQSNGKIALDFADEIMQEYEVADRPEYFELWLANGDLVERSRSLAESDLPRKKDLRLKETKFTDIELPDGRKGRLAQLRFIPHKKDSKAEIQAAEANTRDPSQTEVQAHISVARGRGELDASLQSARLTLGVTALVFLAALYILVRIAVARGLAPLKAVTRQVRALDADSLTGRIDTGQSPKELAPVVTQLNRLLGRLETSFEREKRFSGNVAHELRTPLAELRSIAEIGSKWPDDANLVREFYADLLDVTEGMEHTVANLLTLARCDYGQIDVQLEAVNIAELVQDIWAASARHTGGRSLSIAALLNDELVQTDRNKVKILVQNLLSNALQYSPADAEILVTAKLEENVISIAISNQNSHLEEHDLQHLFERFWQKDPARSSGHHAGLGLALVKALANVLQLKLTPMLEKNVFTISVSGFVRIIA